MIFTDSSTKRFEDFNDADLEKTHDNLGIKYEKTEIYDDTVLLLQYNCPDSDCAHVCRSWDDLYHHVRSVHHKNICKLCLKYKKVFAHEHELLSFRDLQKHERFGDDNPGAVDQSGFKGHPECGFCSERFYGDDELFSHCRDKHEKCHICERQNSGHRPQYFLNYDELEVHFGKDHFLCQDRECLDKKFVVFGSVMDLKGHQLEAHPNGLSKDARRDARRVDISNFDYRTGYQEPRGSRRAGRGRGRDPNSEAIPASSAQPLRRDELAYQRQVDLSNRQNGAPSTGPATQRPTIRPSFQPPVVQMEHMNLGSTDTTETTPQEQARQIQHNAVITRATSLLKNDSVKIDEFRRRVSSYRTSNTSAPELIDGFFQLFDCSSTDMGKLIKELANIYESQAKRDGLLQAWNDWRAINEDYPSLPGLPEPSQPTPNTASTAGRRILRLKSSTAQSSRSATNRSVAWVGGNAPSVTPAANAMAFPSLKNANRKGLGRGTSSWATSSSTPQATNASGRIGQSTVAARGGDAFPALPAAAKPNLLQIGMHRGKVGFWDERAPTTGNPWTTGGATMTDQPSASDTATEYEEFENNGKVKKGKKTKQTLLRYG